MKAISYTTAIEKDIKIILESKELNDLYNNLEDKFTTRAIKFRTVVDKAPMKLSEVNKILHANISPIEYIDVMGNAKIYKVS